jgi:signal transduction histidine kinase
VHTPEAKEGLDRLEKAYREYEAKRDEVVLLYNHGDVEEAKRALLVDVNDLYQKAFEQVEDFVASTQQDADTRMAHVEGQVGWVTALVAIGVAVAMGLGIALVWLFFYGVLRPLRRMMADARRFSGGGATAAAAADEPQDELRAVGDYLRALMSDMADTRSNLERSRHQLLQSEKLASVGKLAASVAHEIRNPLTSMKMWLFSIRKIVGPDPELDHSFDIVAEEMGRLESIVRNFLEFSRPPALKVHPQCVSEVLHKTLELAHHQIDEKRIALQYDTATGLPQVMADREQLKQVFINLLTNAVEATPEEGRICVRAALEGDRQNGAMVVVRVQDSGPGIPEAVRRRVFEPFFTTKEHGTGLGLCIAAQIMGRHGGRLVLESATGQGTSFAVWIPTAAGGEP